MENWHYASLNKNENIYTQKVSGYLGYSLKTSGVGQSKSPDFIVFRHDSLSSGTESEIQHDNWCIDICVAPGDLAKAWDYIFPILAKYECELFRVVNLAAGTSEKNLITLFSVPGQESKYRLAMSEIEPAMKNNNVHPGAMNKAQKPIGVYTAIRFIPGKDTTAGQLNTYNPDHIPEIFYPLSLVDFFQEARQLAVSTVKNKRKLTKKLMIEQIKQANNILVLQDIFHLLKLPEFDYLRKRKKIRLIPMVKGETFAIRTINKAIRKRLVEIATNIKNITVVADRAIRNVLAYKKSGEKPAAPRTLRKYEKLQQKGLIKVMGQADKGLRYKMDLLHR